MAHMRRGFRNVYALMVWCLISANGMAQDIKTEVILAGNLYRLNNVIEMEHIAHLSKSDLRLLKNTILAKHGYIFADEDLRTHFSAFPWYNGNRSEVQGDLSTTDLINAATIYSLENSGEGRSSHTGALGERLIIAEKIRPLMSNFGEPGDVSIGGEMVAFVNGVEMARSAIIDNEFYLTLNEVPPHILQHWKQSYDKAIQFSDPATNIAHLDLRITGTALRITRIGTHDDRDPLLRQYFLDEKRPGMQVNDHYHYDEYFSYVYADRDTFVRGVDHDENTWQGKEIYNVSLKKGWNKLKHYRAEMSGFARYNVHISEATAEKGSFDVFYFDFDDYVHDNNIQLATLEGIVVVDKNDKMEDEFWLLLAEPIRVRSDYNEVRDVHKVLLLVDHETFPRRGNYALFGEIDRFLTSAGDVVFCIIEIEEEL
jgi:hypothetical protein